MMRGMYSAISGLRNHQIMLDVTANDLANVNTVGFKASRTSFRDSLAQLQRSGASATTGQRRREVGPDRPRRPARLDRQPHDQRRVPVDGQPVRRRHHRHRLVPRVEHATRPPAPPRRTPRRSRPPRRTSTPAPGNFTLNDQGELATQDGWRVVGKGVDPTTGGPIDDRHRHQGPRRRDRRLGRRRRRRDLHARRRRHPRHRRLPVAGLVPERVGPGPQLGQPLEGDRRAPAPPPTARPASTASARPSAASSR